MFDCAYKLSFFENLRSETAKKLFEEYFSHKQEFRTLIRIYLKKEWIRVKVESQVIRIPFVHYWIPFKGFNEKWATDDLMKQYTNIKQYEFNAWIDFSPEEQKDAKDSGFSSASIEDEYRDISAMLERKRLREKLLTGEETTLSSTGETIRIPSAHLAAGDGVPQPRKNN